MDVLMQDTKSLKNMNGSIPMLLDGIIGMSTTVLIAFFLYNESPTNLYRIQSQRLIVQ